MLHIAYMHIFLKVRSEDIKYLLNNLLGIVCCASMKKQTQEAYQSVMNVRLDLENFGLLNPWAHPYCSNT